MGIAPRERFARAFAEEQGLRLEVKCGPLGYYQTVRLYR